MQSGWYGGDFFLVKQSFCWPYPKNFNIDLKKNFTIDRSGGSSEEFEMYLDKIEKLTNGFSSLRGCSQITSRFEEVNSVTRGEWV